MHDNGQFARDGDGSLFESDPLTQFQPPCSQGAISAGAGQVHGRCLLKQASQMCITPSRDVPVVIDLARLIATRCQPEPCADRSGLPEVLGILDGCREGCRGDRPDAGDRHQLPTGITVSGNAQQLAPEFCSPRPDGEPGLQKWQQHLFKTSVATEQPTLRVVRFSRRTPSFSSSPMRAWLSDDRDTPKVSAALRKLRWCATAENAARSFRLGRVIRELTSPSHLGLALLYQQS